MPADDERKLTETEAVEKVKSTFDRLAEYGERLGTPFHPATGSDLAAADDELRPLPLSQHIWASLAACFDHLDLIRLTVESRRGFPTAGYSLVRGALLGASTALWLGAGNDHEARVERGRIFSEEWYVQRLRWQSLMTPDLVNVDDAARSGEQMRRFDKDLAELRARRTTKATLNATRIIEEAATLTHPEAPHLARSAVREWRRTGGDAHALGWPLMTQAVDWGERGADGLTSAVATVDLTTLANGYLAAWLALRAAFTRTDALASA